MNCRRLRRLLPLLVGDDLTPGARQACSEHLRSCPACRAAHADWQGTQEALNTLADMTSQSGPPLNTGNWEALRVSLSPHNPQAYWTQRIGVPARYLAAACIALGAVTVAMATFNTRIDPIGGRRVAEHGLVGADAPVLASPAPTPQADSGLRFVESVPRLRWVPADTQLKASSEPDAQTQYRLDRVRLISAGDRFGDEL